MRIIPNKGIITDEPVTPGQHPTILFLHGVGEKGDGTDAGLQSLWDFIGSPFNNIAKALGTIFTHNGKQEEFVLVAPQLHSSKNDWDIATVENGYQFALSMPSVDPSRIAIIGVSLGGGGVWRYISESVTNAKKFSVAISICGVGGWSNLKNVADAGLPVWAFHAMDDGVVGMGNTSSAVDTINSFKPAIPAKKTIYPNGGHYIWARVFDPTVSPGIDGEKATIYDWMLLNTNTIHKPVPTTTIITTMATLTANAGPNQTITGTTATLDGSASVGYKEAWWTYDSFNGNWPGNANYFDGSKFGIKVNLKGLIPGEHVFSLHVSDKVNTQTKPVKITVQAAATAPPPMTKKLLFTLAVFDDGTTQKV